MEKIKYDSDKNIQEIKKIINSNVSPKIMQDMILDYHENDIAASMEKLTLAQRQRLYRILDIDIISDVFEYIEEEDIPKYLEEVDIKKRSAIISAMDADKIVLMLKELDKKQREVLIGLIDDETKRDIALIESFDDDQIGSKMSTNYVSIFSDMGIKQAMKELVKQAADNDNISTLYILDRNNIFCGAISLNDLIIAREGDLLDELVVTSYPYVYANEEIDDCIERIKDYSEDSIPVLDNENRLLGVITAQDIIKVVDDEMGEDYAMLGGLTAEEDLSEPIIESVKKRLPWLLVLLVLGLIVSTVVGLFEDVVAQLTLIICFQSLVLDMAGNVGTQSLAVTIRVLMDENLSAKQKLGLVWKEGRVGILNGLVLGTMSFLFIGLYIHLVKGEAWGFSYAVSVCIGSALLIAMTVSSLFGTMIPMFFKKIKVDPAVASGPLITTINDLVAVVTYYGLAWLFLLQMLKF